jgi:membrane protease YdiL (CAAX protease family)
MDAVVRLGLCIFATASVGVVLAGLLDSTLIKMSADHRQFAQMAVMETFVDGGALVWIGSFLRENKISRDEAFGLEAVRRTKAVLWGLLAATLFVPVALGLQYLSSWLLQHPEAQEMVQVLQRADLPAGERVFIGFLAVLIAPLAEEAMFRGILYPTIKQAGYPRAAVWVTSLLFGAVHFNVPSFVPLVVFSMLLIYLYEKTGSLLASITAHSLFNYANFVFLMLSVSPAPPVTVK